MALKSVSDCVLGDHNIYFDFPKAMKDLNEAVMDFVDAWEA